MIGILAGGMTNPVGTTLSIDRALPDKADTTIAPKSSTEGVVEIDTEEGVDSSAEALAEEASTVGVLRVAEEAVEVEGEGGGVGGGVLLYLPRSIKAKYPTFHLFLQLV